MRYYKVTNQDECHYGMQYRDGLNVDIRPFAKEGSCVPGGLYFTNAANIRNYYDYGAWVREVHLPTHIPGFQMVEDPEGDKWRASCIVLGKRISLFDAAACQDLGVPVMSMEDASRRGATTVLDWWKASGLKLDYSETAIHQASAFGQIDVLQWWKDSGLELKYSNDCLDFASISDKVKVLTWWKESGLPLKYTHEALDRALQYRNVAALEWWKGSGLHLRYTTYTVYQQRYDLDLENRLRLWPKLLEWVKSLEEPTDAFSYGYGYG